MFLTSTPTPPPRQGYWGVPGIAHIPAMALPAWRIELSSAKGREVACFGTAQKRTNADEGLLQNYTSIWLLPTHMSPTKDPPLSRSVRLQYLILGSMNLLLTEQRNHFSVLCLTHKLPEVFKPLCFSFTKLILEVNDVLPLVQGVWVQLSMAISTGPTSLGKAWPRLAYLANPIWRCWINARKLKEIMCSMPKRSEVVMLLNNPSTSVYPT